ncbi:putative heat shock protein [Erwinia phage vB_EamM_Caitlin]|uniref:putative heat shock protein n=1 Tax=Erwinia phage vB_EamM_Caitlin TaxID=1883379 RepID=UPI00081CB547|nr:putative heat shock protein [Erwinia phage vB_EamM_Caitlin]ANZ48422.1 putative heat shock protein [Erwinia phage vB_EamM_Caitlin]
MDKLTPVEIVSVFDQFVYGQALAKKMLAIALRNRIRIAQLSLKDRGSVRKQNLLLIGPTGVGKTALMRVLRNRFGLPVLEVDMTGFSETGYVGRNVSTIGTDLASLAKSTPLPEWYITLRTGMTLEKEEKRHTREEWEALQVKEKEQQYAEEQTEREKERAAKREHEIRLTSMGILPDEEDYKRIRKVFYMRAFILGYCHIKNLPFDDIDLREMEIFPGQTVDGLAKRALQLMETVTGQKFDSMESLESFDSDLDLEESVSEHPQLMGEMMALLPIAETISSIIEQGLSLMGSNPVAACVSGNDWFDVAYSFDGEKQDIPPGIGWRYFDDTEWLIGLMFEILFNYDELMETYWSVEDFTQFADEKIWAYDVKADKPKWNNPTGVLTKKDLLKVDNCNARDFVENFAVVFLDEFDKLIETDTTGRTHVSRSGVQRSLLKMVEGGLYSGIDTTNVLFVAAGTFAEAPLSKLLPELQGRFPLRAQLEPLDIPAIEAICRLDTSDFHSMIKLLSLEGVKVRYDADTYLYIAEQTMLANQVDNLGARRLDAIVERILQAALYEPEKYLEHGYDITGATLRGLDG